MMLRLVPWQVAFVSTNRYDKSTFVLSTTKRWLLFRPMNNTMITMPGQSDTVHVSNLSVMMHVIEHARHR